MSKPNKKKKARSKVTEMPKRPDNGDAGFTVPPGLVEQIEAKLRAEMANQAGPALQHFTRVANDGHRQGFLLIPYTSGYRTFVDGRTGEVAIVLATSQYFDKGFTARTAVEYIERGGQALTELGNKGIDFVCGLGNSCQEHADAAREERFHDMLRDIQRQPKVDANALRVYKQLAPNRHPAGTASIS